MPVALKAVGWGTEAAVTLRTGGRAEADPHLVSAAVVEKAYRVGGTWLAVGEHFGHAVLGAGGVV